MARFDSSPPISMPMPVINVQMPSADAPYGQPDASEHPYATEPPYASEPPYTPEHLYPFQQSYVAQEPCHVPPHASVSPYHTELQNDVWVPKVPGPSDEEEVDPTSEAICIPTPEYVQTGASVSRRPSRIQRLASFLGLRSKESTASRQS